MAANDRRRRIFSRRQSRVPKIAVFGLTAAASAFPLMDYARMPAGLPHCGSDSTKRRVADIVENLLLTGCRGSGPGNR